MWTSAAVVGGATLGGALLNSNAAGSAAETQANATRAGIAEQAREYAQTRLDTKPWRDTGSAAVYTIGQLMGLGPTVQNIQRGGTPNADNYIPLGSIGKAPEVGTVTENPSGGYQKLVTGPDGNAQWTPMDPSYKPPSLVPGAGNGSGAPGMGAPLSRTFSVSDFWNDPVVQLGYNSGLELGTKALKNAAPLTTGIDSGAALKELTQFGTDYTGRQAAGSQARFVGDQTNLYNRLAGLAGIGQNAVNTTAATGATTSTNTSNMITGQGNASAAAKIAGANAWGGGLNSIANFWNQQQMLGALKGGGNQNTYPAPWQYNSTGMSNESNMPQW